MGILERRKGAAFTMDSASTWVPVFTIFLTFLAQAWANEPRVVCYYTNWSVYRPGTAKFNPQNINPYLCTHLIYAFGGFTKDNTLKPFDKYQDIEKGGYAKFTGLKTYNKNLKTMLAIGGWNEGSTRFSPMVASRDRRKEFVRNAIKFLRQNRFDGLDLDWEYPAFRDGGKPKDRENYSKLVKELREEFDRESEKSGRPRLLLTMAVPAGIEYIQKGFDVKTLNRYLDWMNLLTYDYHSAFEPAVNHHAPLYPLEEPNEYSVDNELNIDYTIKFYIENGADRDKLVLGIPTYGRSYTLFNPDATEIGSPADGPGDQGEATREKGYLAYYEICDALNPKTKKEKRKVVEDSDEESEEEEEEEEDLPWTIVYPNESAMGPVAYKGNQWVGYDDVGIVQKKAEYVAENGLGGIMFWSIDNDDFRGTCHGKPYPLIEAAKEAYINRIGATDNVVVTEKSPSSSSRRKNRPRSTTVKPTTAARLSQSNKRKQSSSTSTTPVWSVNTPEPPTTPDPGSDFKCTEEGFFQHPRDCKKYFWCLDSGPSNLGIVAHQFTCPSGLFFNKAADSCDFARNVFCKKSADKPTTSKPTTSRASTTTVTTTTEGTTRKPIKLSTRNSLLFRTTTTTAAPIEEEENDASEDTSDVDAEDPRVIKELIDLIKKVGGVEQLEKHLHLAETSMSTGNEGTTTPSSFKKKLYQKVLERTRSKNTFNTISDSKSLNSGRGPQNAGLENLPEVSSVRKERPQYKTINRARASTSTTEEPIESEEEDEEQKEEPTQPLFVRARAEDEDDSKLGSTAKPLQYVNIRRARPNLITTSDTADDTATRNALFERHQAVVTSSEPSSLNLINSKRESVPEYVTIRRQRPSVEESTTAQLNSAEKDEEPSESEEKETTSSSSLKSQFQYTSIVRGRSTTTSAPSELPLDAPEPTTVLAVQISSLLNSPASTLADEISTEMEITLPTSVVTEPSTTTTTTSAPRITSLPRRNAFKRRGSTASTTTTTSTATPQVTKRHRVNFLRRTKATPPPTEVTESLDNDLTTEFSTIVENTSSKYTRRGQSKFDVRRPSPAQAQINEPRKPARKTVRRRLGSPSNNESSSTTSTQRTPSSSSRRPFRTANRIRTITRTTSTTAAPTTIPSSDSSEEFLEDIQVKNQLEEPKARRAPLKKIIKVQRRPLTSLKPDEPKFEKDQNSSATTDEQNKRQSKKYSSSFKQNQLDEVIRQKSKSEEVTDGTTGSTFTSEDLSAETAVAIAAHQLFGAPLPITENYEDSKLTSKRPLTTNTYTTEDYTYTPKFTDPFGFQTTEGLTGKVIFSSSFPSGYTSTPSYASTSRSPLPPQYPITSGISSNSVGYSGVSQPHIGSTARYLGTSEKYVSIPVEEFGYSTDAYSGGLGQEPVYFTREYLLESPVTKTYDDEYQYLSPITRPQTTTTRKPQKKVVSRKISTTQRPTVPSVTTPKPRRMPQKKPFEKITKNESKKVYRPVVDYDYYDDSDEKLVNKYGAETKVIVHGKGSIQCFDIGNFPHPGSCKKFISCAKMDNNSILGWEYICPKGLSFDPVGGICNWSAGLGCDEK